MKSPVKEPKQKEDSLQEALNAFFSMVAKKEGKKSQTSIGNLRESGRVMDELLGGKLYKDIKAWHKNGNK